MPVCIVKGCSSRSSKKGCCQEKLEKTTRITLHAFPKCDVKRQLWLNSLGLQNSVLPKYPAVCSVHFSDKDLDRTSLIYVRLKQNAVPYVKFPEFIKEEKVDVREEILTEKPSTSVCLDRQNTSSAVITVETGQSVRFIEPTSITGGKRRSTENTGSHEISKHASVLLQPTNKSPEANVSLVDKHTCISPKRLFESPRKQILRDQIFKLKRRQKLELNALQKKHKRKEKRILNLQTILKA